MTEPLVQLFEIVSEANGGITPDEIRSHFEVVRDWADRECLPASEATKARAIGLEAVKRERS